MAPLRRPSYVMSSMSWTMLAITFMTYWLVIVHQGYQSALMIYKKMLKAHYKSASNTGTLEPCGEISRPSWRNMFQLDQLETSEKDLSGCCVCHSFPFPVWSLRRAFPLPLPPSHPPPCTGVWPESWVLTHTCCPTTLPVSPFLAHRSSPFVSTGSRPVPHLCHILFPFCLFSWTPDMSFSCGLVNMYIGFGSTYVSLYKGWLIESIIIVEVEHRVMINQAVTRPSTLNLLFKKWEF